MANANVAQSDASSMKRSITEIDMTVQIAQKQAEALVSGVRALLSSKGGVQSVNLRSADVLCESLDSVLFSLMNDVNYMAERHGAHYMEDASV
jgi:hypothetical protein